MNLFIGHKAGSTHSYFSSTPDVYRWYGLFAVAKTVEVFANGVIIFGFRLRQLDPARASASGGVFTPSPHGFGIALGSRPSQGGGMEELSLSGESNAPRSPLMKGAIRSSTSVAATVSGGMPNSGSGGSLTGHGLARNPSAAVFTFDREEQALNSLRDRRSKYVMGAPNAPSLTDRMRDLVRDVALHFVLPRTSLTPLLSQGLLSAQEIAYAYCAWKVRGICFLSALFCCSNNGSHIIKNIHLDLFFVRLLPVSTVCSTCSTSCRA